MLEDVEMRWYKTVGRMNVLVIMALCFILMPKLHVEAADSGKNMQSVQAEEALAQTAETAAAKQAEIITEPDTAEERTQAQAVESEKAGQTTEASVQEQTADIVQVPAAESVDAVNVVTEQTAAAAQEAPVDAESKTVEAPVNAENKAADAPVKTESEAVVTAADAEKTEDAEDDLERQKNAALYTAKHTFNKLIAEGVTEDEAIELVNKELENVADIVEKSKTDPDAAQALEDWQAAAEDCMAALEEQETEAEQVANSNYVYPATEEEIRLLSALIYCEAGNQSREGKVAVGNVVLNRIRSAKFPNTMKEVIYQRGQFSPVGSGWLSWVLRKGEIPESCREAAIAALQGEAPVGNAIFFMRKNLHYTGMIIGAHCFWGTV